LFTDGQNSATRNILVGGQPATAKSEGFDQ
jgi:hypothetical protein